MSSKSDLLEPNQIGTFLHYAVLDAAIRGYDKIEQSIIKSLGHLFTFNEKDLLLMSKFLGLNDFRNVELLEKPELTNSKVDLSNIMDCFKGLITYSEEKQKFKKVKEYVPFSSPSPCFNLSYHTGCNAYCEWHKKVFANWTELDSISLQRYF